MSLRNAFTPKRLAFRVWNNPVKQRAHKREKSRVPADTDKTQSVVVKCDFRHSIDVLCHFGVRIETVNRVKFRRNLCRRVLQIALRADAQQHNVHIEFENIVLRVYVRSKIRFYAVSSRKYPDKFYIFVGQRDFFTRFAEIPVADNAHFDFPVIFIFINHLFTSQNAILYDIITHDLRSRGHNMS